MQAHPGDREVEQRMPALAGPTVEEQSCVPGDAGTRPPGHGIGDRSSPVSKTLSGRYLSVSRPLARVGKNADAAGRRPRVLSRLR